MHCPFCGADDTKVIDSRLVAEGDSVRRRRECQTCGERYTTFETAELAMPRIVKRDGTREPFNEDKLRYGLQKALEKRPVSVEEIESGLSRIMHQLRSTGERELSSQFVGQGVMNELRRMDAVAYVRFASVYRDFQDVSEFQTEIQKLNAIDAATDAATDAASAADADSAGKRTANNTGKAKKKSKKAGK